MLTLQNRMDLKDQIEYILKIEYSNRPAHSTKSVWDLLAEREEITSRTWMDETDLARIEEINNIILEYNQRTVVEIRFPLNKNA